MTRQRASRANEAFARIGQAQVAPQVGSDLDLDLDLDIDAIEAVADAPGNGQVIISAELLPAPYVSDGDAPLTEREQADLHSCETALESLRVAFCAAGKALQLIRDARLYRATHDSFEEYLRDRWDMSRPQAYRLIDAWPLAEQLSPMGDRLNERQVRELLPLAGRHGPEAAVTVYQVVVQTEGVQPTAAILHGAVELLPEDHFDPIEATTQIQAFLSGNSAPPSAEPSDPLQNLSAATSKLLRICQRELGKRKVRAAIARDPEAAREVIAGFREFLDDLERSLATKT